MRFVALVALATLVTLATFVSFVSLVSLVSVVSLCYLVHQNGRFSRGISYYRNDLLIMHRIAGMLAAKTLYVKSQNAERRKQGESGGSCLPCGEASLALFGIDHLSHDIVLPPTVSCFF